MFSADSVATSLSHRAWLPVLALAFAGGLLNALLPCSVSMLPLTIAYISGSTTQPGPAVWVRTAGFVLGLCLSLTLLGLLAAWLGISLGTAVGPLGYALLGVLALIMGAQMMGWLALPVLPSLSRLPAWAFGHPLSPLILGFLFGLTASPCGTPFLTVLLGFIAQQHDVTLGVAGLFAYALGQSTLLWLAGLGAGLISQRARLLQLGTRMNQLSGFLLLCIGCYWLYQSLH